MEKESKLTDPPVSTSEHTPVKPVPSLVIDKNTKNVVLGSSIFARVKTDGFFQPKNDEFPAFSGSNTLEKIRNLKTVQNKIFVRLSVRMKIMP